MRPKSEAIVAPPVSTSGFLAGIGGFESLPRSARYVVAGEKTWGSLLLGLRL